jgi:phage-related protein
MKPLRPVEWVASSRDDVRAFPKEVRAVIGEALYRAQQGKEHPAVKALKGFGGRGVLEIIDDFDGGTFRAVYSVRLAGVVYVLHAFQKKSKAGRKTPQHDIELIRNRLRRAEAHYRDTYARHMK